MRFDSTYSRVLLGQRRQGGPAGQGGRGRREAGFMLSFAEVLVAVVIVAVVCGTILVGYISGAKRTQWSGYSLAAQSMGVQCVEQARSAVWDIALGKNELAGMTLSSYASNSTTLGTYKGYIITGYTTNIMDIPWKGTNYLIATNFFTITKFLENNYVSVPVELQSVQVDTVWPFDGWGNFTVVFYTNSVITYIAPDNRDPITLGGGG